MMNDKYSLKEYSLGWVQILKCLETGLIAARKLSPLVEDLSIQAFISGTISLAESVHTLKSEPNSIEWRNVDNISYPHSKRWKFPF